MVCERNGVCVYHTHGVCVYHTLHCHQGGLPEYYDAMNTQIRERQLARRENVCVSVTKYSHNKGG